MDRPSLNSQGQQHWSSNYCFYSSSSYLSNSHSQAHSIDHRFIVRSLFTFLEERKPARDGCRRARHRDLGWPNSNGFGSGLDSEVFRWMHPDSGFRDKFNHQIPRPCSSAARPTREVLRDQVELSTREVESVGMFDLPTSMISI